MQQDHKAITIQEAQKTVRGFVERNRWKDVPAVDKFDHLHEELIEMSRYLRYRNEDERLRFVEENATIFVDGIGDLFFGLLRLANQLNVDVESAFILVTEDILKRYGEQSSEQRPAPTTQPTTLSTQHE